MRISILWSMSTVWSRPSLLLLAHLLANLGEWILVLGTSLFILRNRSADPPMRTFSKMNSVFHALSATLALVTLIASSLQEHYRFLAQVFLLFITAQAFLCPVLVIHTNSEATKSSAGISTRPPTASTIKRRTQVDVGPESHETPQEVVLRV